MAQVGGRTGTSDRDPADRETEVFRLSEAQENIGVILPTPSPIPVSSGGIERMVLAVVVGEALDPSAATW